MEKKLAVPEVHCQHCVSSIEGAVGELPGIESVKVDLETKRVDVSFDENQVQLDQIIQTISHQGYDVGENSDLLQLDKPPSG